MSVLAGARSALALHTLPPRVALFLFRARRRAGRQAKAAVGHPLSPLGGAHAAPIPAACPRPETSGTGQDPGPARLSLWFEPRFEGGPTPDQQRKLTPLIERDVEGKLPDRGAEIVLYCGGGFRSALAADNLQKMGYTNVISMDGGWRGWTGKGYPTEK